MFTGNGAGWTDRRSTERRPKLYFCSLSLEVSVHGLAVPAKCVFRPIFNSYVHAEKQGRLDASRARKNTPERKRGAITEQDLPAVSKQQASGEI